MVVCTKSVQFWRDQHVLVVFHKLQYFFDFFPKNWVKIVKKGSFHKTCLVLARSTRYDGFSQKAVLFATFCYKLGKNPKTIQFAQEVFSFGEIDTFWWFFSKCHTFCNFLLKIGSKPLNIVVCTKRVQFWRDRHVLLVSHKMPYFFQLFAKNWVNTLKHCSLLKKCLVLARSTRLSSFSQNAILFATFF